MKNFARASVLVALGLCARTAAGGPSFWTFESGQVRPLAQSPSGSWLYAVNTPDDRVEVFSLGGDGRHPQLVGSVTVGLEPVAIGVRNETEIWVTNLVSDSVSIVDVSNPAAPRVDRTLLVGDEPRDVVFAGRSHDRAFITTAHRGQNIPFDPQLLTPSVGRADVWIFDANHTGDSFGGNPLEILTLFTDTPRALAVSPDERYVYAAGFNTGNQTTNVGEIYLYQTPQLFPQPQTNYAGVPMTGDPMAPVLGLIVKYDGSHWVDIYGTVWDSYIMLNLPDKDVFTIDADADPPAPLDDPGHVFSHVGTVLYNMAVNPVTGALYVSNTDANNLERFSGPGIFSNGHTVTGKNNFSQITVISGQNVEPRQLNKHIDYSRCCAPVPNAENALSVAIPTGLAVSSDGKTLYAAMLGSDKIAIYDTAALENDTFLPNLADQIKLSNGGPTGLVLDDHRKLLYVMTRFSDSITTIDVKTRQEVSVTPMFNPEPPEVVRGRPFLYDARSSSHGDQACASCHVFGDKDDLAWDLGNPDADFAPNNNPFQASVQPFPADPAFTPMKGPMTTQSLRGMANHGPMHWRGDRTGSVSAPNVQPDSGAFDEHAAFVQFQEGFQNLNGTPGPIPAADMDAFATFILKVVYPPNPNRNLDDSLTPDQQAGSDHFFNAAKSDAGLIECQGCHHTDPTGNAEFGVEFPGFFGTQGMQARDPFPQTFKIPHLRNLYTKVGKFGFASSPFYDVIPGQEGFLGDQIRGFGFSRAGDVDSVLRFTGGLAFTQAFPFAPNPNGFLPGAAGIPARTQVADFLLAFPTNLKPIVGQQITMRRDNLVTTAARVNLLVQRADAGDCDLVVKAQGLLTGEHGYLYVGGGEFQPDSRRLGNVSLAALRLAALVLDQRLTLTAVPPGSGHRIGIDRDDDGILDADEH